MGVFLQKKKKEKKKCFVISPSPQKQQNKGDGRNIGEKGKKEENFTRRSNKGGLRQGTGGGSSSSSL